MGRGRTPSTKIGSFLAARTRVLRLRGRFKTLSPSNWPCGAHEGPDYTGLVYRIPDSTRFRRACKAGPRASSRENHRISFVPCKLTGTGGFRAQGDTGTGGGLRAQGDTGTGDTEGEIKGGHEEAVSIWFPVPILVVVASSRSVIRCLSCCGWKPQPL